MTVEPRRQDLVGTRAPDPALDLTFRRSGARTRLCEQTVRYPFHITRPFYFDTVAAPGLATLYLQSASGGLYRGERLPVRIAASDGAEVCLTTQSSTVVHDARGVPTVATTTIEAGDGAVVFHVPDPLILLPGAELQSSVRVRRQAGATVVVSEAFLCHDPAPSGRTFAAFSNEVRIESPEGVAEAIDRQVLAGGDLAAASRLGERVAAGGFMIAGPLAADADPVAFRNRIGAVEGARIGVSRLPFETGLSVRIAADGGVALTRALDAVFVAAFHLIYGADPVRRRK
jgi:urease accessory protein